MLNKTVSYYKDHINAKRGKQVLSVIANVALVFICSVLLFTLVFKMIGDHLPAIKTTLNEMAQKEKEFHDERKNAGLLVYDEKNNLYTKESVIYKTIKNETKTAINYYNLQETYKEYETYKTSEIIDDDHLINNAIMYYYCDYKVNNKSYYEQNPAKDDYFIDFYANSLVSKPDYEVYDLSSKVNERKHFTKDVTLLLADYYFAQDQYKKAQETNKDVFKMFDESYNLALEDFNENNLKSAELLKQYDEKHDVYSNSLIIELFLSYFVSTLLIYLLPYLIRKDFDSVGSLVCKIPIVTKEGYKINVFHELGIIGINFVSNFYILFIVILMIFGHPGLALHNFGFMNIGVLSIFSILFSLISLVLMLTLKNHQFIDAFSMICCRKDKEEMEVLENKEEENGK